MPMMLFTNQGPDLEGNQDAVLAGDVFSGLSLDCPIWAPAPGPVVAVADGMGGGPGGAKAAEVLLADLQKKAQQPLSSEVRLGLVKCFYRSLHHLTAAVSADPSLKGMGATIAGLWRQNDKVTVFNCGDCRVYRLRNGTLELLSRDHSLVYSLYLEGLISFEEIRFHPQKNLITSAIQEGAQSIDIFTRDFRLAQGDVFFICSDGVWESLSEDEINGFIEGADLETAAHDLAQALLDNNSGDNFSFLLGDF
jgi:protein phosphatase